MLGPLTCSPLRSPPHPSSPRSSSVKYHSLTSIVCIFNTILNEPKSLKTKLRAPLSYVCIYVACDNVHTYGCCLLTHAQRTKENVTCPVLLLFLPWEKTSHWTQRYSDIQQAPVILLACLHSTRVTGTQGPHSAFYIGAWNLNSTPHVWTTRALTHLPICPIPSSYHCFDYYMESFQAQYRNALYLLLVNTISSFHTLWQNPKWQMSYRNHAKNTKKLWGVPENKQLQQQGMWTPDTDNYLVDETDVTIPVAMVMLQEHH